MKYSIKLLVLILFLNSITANLFSQCAMCKAVAESDLENNPNSVARGINEGILFLMVIPYILMAFFFRKEIIRFFKNKTEDSN